MGRGAFLRHNGSLPLFQALPRAEGADGRTRLPDDRQQFFSDVLRPPFRRETSLCRRARFEWVGLVGLGTQWQSFFALWLKLCSSCAGLLFGVALERIALSFLLHPSPRGCLRIGLPSNDDLKREAFFFFMLYETFSSCSLRILAR